MENIIEIKNLSKEFTLYNSQKEKLFGLFLPKKYGKRFKALKNIDFSARKGETIGFVGINGSGKSTLLNIIAGIAPESSGEMKIEGKTSMISTGEEFKPTLTGRENLEMRCLMLGFSKKEIEKMEKDIITFAEIDDLHMDQPVKSYSSGMKARLGFAISVTVNPDILIIDEALSVGDQTFAMKCLKKIKEFQADGKTIIFVSHNHGQVKEFCDKVLWLEYGVVKEFGDTKTVMKHYEEFIKFYKSLNEKEKSEYQRKNKYEK